MTDDTNINEVLTSLNDGATDLMESVDWNHTGLGMDSTCNLVEAHALLTYFKRKLKQIADREHLQL